MPAMIAGDQGSPAPSNGHALLSVEQAARRLGVTPLTIRRQIKAGNIASERGRGKFGPEWRVMIAPDDQAGPEQRSADDQAGPEQRSADDRSTPAQRSADDRSPPAQRRADDG